MSMQRVCMFIWIAHARKILIVEMDATGANVSLYCSPNIML